MAQVVKKILLVVVLIIAGCHCVSQAPIRPTDKVDRQSELYQDILSRVIRLKLLEQEEKYYSLRE